MEIKILSPEEVEFKEKDVQAAFEKDLSKLEEGLEFISSEFETATGRIDTSEFVDVMSASDGQAIGPKMSAKLHCDFVAFARKARKHFTRTEELAWMWDVYRDFRKAFKIASDGGFVCYR